MDILSSTNASQMNPDMLQNERPDDIGQDIMGKEDFLQLLVTQLKSQDPMNPMKDQEFAAQLAQFSSLEQLLNINETLGGQSESTSALADRINRSTAADLLGKDVQAAGDVLGWTGEGEVPLSFELDGPAEEVTIAVKDAGGTTVFEQNLGVMDEGFHEFAWDGKNADGNEVPYGTYTFAVEAVDSEGESVATDLFANGKVDRVTFGSEGPMLWINGRQVPMDQVRSVTVD